MTTTGTDGVGPAEHPKDPTPTRYVILRLDHDSETANAKTDAWVELTRVEATSALSAIRSTKPGDGDTYIAVPERSFQPVTVKTEQRTITRLEAAS